MSMIGLASDDWCGCACGYSNDVSLREVSNYFGTSYIRDQLKKQGKQNLQRLMYEVEEALGSLQREETLDNPYYMWDHRKDVIERSATREGVWYTVLPISSDNGGVYGEVMDWMTAEGWPILGDVHFLDDTDHPTAKDSQFNPKKFPPGSFKFRLKNSEVKKNFESDFKRLLGDININM